MAKTDFRSVDEYIASRPAVVQAALQRVRGAIRKAMPDAEEVISYQMPAYRLGGGVAIYFAGWKEHYSLYPTTAPLLAAFPDELARYEVSKGTIRFPLDEPVPVKLIERIARFRAQEALARQRAKAEAKAASRSAAKAASSGGSKAKAGSKTKVGSSASAGKSRAPAAGRSRSRTARS